MRIKHAPNDVQSMSQDGKAILRSLPNNNLSHIDLMVRESIQNSLDATIDNMPKTIVDFSTGEFESEKLASNFEEIEDVLLERYPGNQRFIAVSDKNTYGLTGDYSSDDIRILNNSNFHKLVFGIGKNQDKDGAGGSWGLGKTSYFRMGVGIVIYYTRIKINDKYEERLIASLIEDPTKEDRILSSNERGIAWWGEYVINEEKISPITDKEQIGKILSLFNLENYKNEETGTSIIIPYLKDLQVGMVEKNSFAFPWEVSMEEDVMMAVQRWYFPRIWNGKYHDELGNSILDCKVNNTSIHPNINFEPIFKYYQELYISALLGKAQSPEIKVEQIKLGTNAMLNQKEPIGYVAFREVSREQLKMTAPENKPSGLAYLGIKDVSKMESDSSKVVAYSRKPGMVVEYSVDGPWSNGDIVLKDGHMLIAFFVPNSNGELASRFKDVKLSTVESYLRSVENSDHAVWEDVPGVSVITRIRNYTNKIIKSAYQSEDDYNNSSVTSSLSRKFGAILMPPKNFGKTSANAKTPGKAIAINSKNRGSDITVIRSNPKNEFEVEVAFKAFIKKESNNRILLQVLSQDQKIDQASWYKSMGDTVKFPFVIKDVMINKINNDQVEKSIFEIEENDMEFKLEEVSATYVDINSNLQEGIEIEGTLNLDIKSNQYLPNIAIRTIQ